MTRQLTSLVLAALVFAVGCGGSTAANDAGTSGTGGGTGNNNSDSGVETPDAGGPSTLSGTLGTLGAVKPIVSSWYISHSGETIVYLSSAPLTCATMQTSRWLGSQPSGSQVVEIIMAGTPTNGQTVNVPPGEANYAAGGKSSAYEVVADSGKIVYTSVTANTTLQGTVQATYPSGSLSGSFNAQFCANGQQF